MRAPNGSDVEWSQSLEVGDSQAERQERRGSLVYAKTINSAPNRPIAAWSRIIRDPKSGTTRDGGDEKLRTGWCCLLVPLPFSP
jgi:hypothetical protein